MDVKWVKIRAWHAVKATLNWDITEFQYQQTHCGRVALGEVVDDLPAEKSCESCLRIIARKADQ